MGKCVVFCAAGFDTLVQPIETDDVIIAADGGFVHTQKLQITPDIVLGDFDSLGYTPEGANVFPVEKDDTDAMLAVRHGLSRGYRTFLLYGSLGIIFQDLDGSDSLDDIFKSFPGIRQPGNDEDFVFG